MTALPIELPIGFKPLVAEGESVIEGQIIAQKAAPKEEIVNILQALNIPRSQVKNVLKKAPGDKIKQGDIVAVKKNFWGKVKGTIISEISGIILRYERDTGNLVVRTEVEVSSLELISPVAGIVTLCNNREIVIQTTNALITTGASLGTTGEGELFVLKESFDNNSDNVLYYLDGRVAEKIVLMHTITRESVIKGSSIGIAGLLGLELPNEDIVYLQEKGNILPVLEITQEIIPKLQEWEGRKIMIEGKSKAIILQN